MITASFYNNPEQWEASLTVKGHAGQADVGKDIVCASASILAYTLAQIVHSLRHRFEGEPTIRLESGDTTISCKCKNYRTYVKVLSAFNYTQVGFTFLAQSYPQFVELKLFGQA